MFVSVCVLSPSSCRLCWTCKATAFSSERLEKSCAAQVDSMSSSVCYVAVFSKLLLLLFVLIASVLIQSVAPNVFFPVETSRDLVQYRSLKDILFRSQSEDNDQQHSIQSPVVASFRPANPSPTLASSPHSGAVGVSKIRFLDADEFFVPNFSPVPHSELIPPAAQTEGRRANSPNLNPDHTTVVRQAKSPEINQSAIGTSVTGSPAQDRWPWPYSKPIKQAVNIQSRQQQSPSLIVKKSVAKPYRLLTRTSSCPKLLHDLTITCSWPKQQQLQQPVEFQWYKTQHRSVAETQNNLLESTIKTPIAFGTQMIHKDPRYGVSVVSDSAYLTIRQLKPQDCGSYICEAVDVHNTTVISNTEFLIFLCY